MADVVVVGSGISGAAAAYEMAKDGLDVVVVDRFGPAAMASGWSLAGVRQSGRHPAELPLAKAAVQAWSTLADELDAPTHYRRGGNLRLARTAAEVPVIQDLVENQAKTGLEISLLSGNADIRAVCPAISEHVLAASYCPSDGSADAAATVAAFVSAGTRHGVTTRYGDKALAIQVRDGRATGVITDKGVIAAPRVVVAAGIFGNDLLAPLGHKVPLSVPMVTVLRSAPLAPMLEQVIGVANADCAGRQEYNGRFRVTSGLQDWHGHMIAPDANAQGRPRVRPTPASIAQVATLFGDLVPAFANAEVEEIWGGLVDLTPDALPVLDMVPDTAGVVVAIGFSGHGFCLGPVTGKILSDLVQDRPARLPIEAFALRRFAGWQAPAEPLTLHG